MTEKLLLFGNAIKLAGTVKARKSRRHAASDWMAMEKERGISVTTSVMQFDYADRVVNLLDTPGSRGLLRGHVQDTDRGGLRAHGDRRGQGRGARER